VAALVLVVGGGRAVGQESGESEESESEETSPWDLSVGGYGSLNFDWRDYGPDPTREGGSRDDSRVVFDQTRFVLDLEAEMPAQLAFEAEVEFEHGGTGSALELEYEEFGEYEREVEKGGEVLVEELYLEKGFGEHVSARVGRFYVATGLMSSHYKPTDYLGAGRPESESTVLPAVWDEMGVDLTLDFDPVRGQVQLVNGLDSTGFSSQRWVASGHQSRFEQIRATSLAVVGRVDVEPVDGLVVGGSAYWGGTSANRPKPDLARECDGESSDREVAPCGYVPGNVLIADLHVTLDLDPVRARGTVIWGNLENAETISERNRSLSNNLGVLRSSVSDEALAAWGELGVDVAPVFGLSERHRLEPNVRVEHYDTQFRPRESLEDNPRFERSIGAAGVAYTYRDVLVTKINWSHRWFGSSELNAENTVSLSQGLEF
jgi:hypothetical protein